MKKTILFLMALLLLVTGIACRKTPSALIVVGKGDAALEKTIATASTAAAAKPVEAPDHWTEQLKKDKLTIDMDADIFVPDAAQFSVTALVESEISQEQADKILNVLLGDAIIYEQRPDNAYTKEEIAQEILRLQEEISDPNSFFNMDYEKGTPEYEDGVARLKKDIKLWEEAYKTAPDSFEPKVIERTFQARYHPEMAAPLAIPDDATDEQRKQIEADNKALAENPEAGSFTAISGIAKLGNGKSAQVTVSNWDAVYVLTGPSAVSAESIKHYKDSVPELESGITQQQAQDLAVQTIKDMGLDHLDITDCEIAYQEERGKEGPPTAVRPCYKFGFTRSIGGIMENVGTPKYIPETSTRSGGPTQYGKFVPHESATVVVSKDGICMFHWSSPTKIIDTVAQNVELLAFADIQEIFRKQIFMNYSNMGDDLWGHAIAGRCIIIERAKLGFMNVARQGHEGEYMLIPVWDFYGYDTMTFENPNIEKELQLKLNENGESESKDFDYPNQTFLTINAIDGSIVDRFLGF